MFRQWLTLVIIVLVYIPVAIDATVLHVAAPTLSMTLGASGNELLWIIDIYSLVMAGMVLPMGALGDRIGFKRLLMLGGTLFGLASLAAAFSHTASWLIATRVLLAIGAAMIVPATLAGIRATFCEEKHRNMALGVWAAVGSGGAAFGPLIGGILLEHFYWGSVFLINVPIVLVVMGLTARYVPRQAGRRDQPAISTYLDGFHFYSGDKNGQMEAHHYVTVLNEDVMQAVIYDGNTKNARLMGVEYIISERLFKTLPPEEKKLWHSHQYEVKSGSLVAPGLPQVADKALMSKIVNTYGKTWHTWHTDRDKTLPMGIPALMMGFTGDGQLDPALLADRDRRLGIDTQAIKRERQDLPEHPVVKGANAWEQGEVIQLQRVQGSGEHGRGDTAHFGTSEQSRQ